MVPWLHRYGNGQHLWYRAEAQNRVVFERQIGLVETSFDIDGVYYGGRADLCNTLELEIRSSLTEAQLLERITLAWAVLRLSHPLLLSGVEDRKSPSGLQRCFVVSTPNDPSTALAEAQECVSSLLDRAGIESLDFRQHALNTGRIVDPNKALSKIFVLPLVPVAKGRFRLTLILIMAHMIADGLTSYNWNSDFISLLNKDERELKKDLAHLLQPDEILAKLPPAQEDLYPPVASNKARERWFWAITRILRHVRKSLPIALVNPLRRPERRQLEFESTYDGILDYSTENLPPMNSSYCYPTLSLVASKRLATLCKQAGASVGAGVFALVGVVMMELEEQLRPHVSLSERRPFVASFPLNPRLFFNYTGPYDSCMLAFSDGIVMPFLSSSLNLEGRIRLLAKIAHRQLRTYQRRTSATINSHTPIRMIAQNYLIATEMVEVKSPPEYRQGVNPQGDYPSNFRGAAATCGVSSVGSVKHWAAPGRYDLEEGSGKDLVADYRGLKGGVRARENEFLCGCSSDAEGTLTYAVSYDLSAMDEVLVEKWKGMVETILEPDGGPRL